jgi:hypothetical protein
MKFFLLGMTNAYSIHVLFVEETSERIAAFVLLLICLFERVGCLF